MITTEVQHHIDIIEKVMSGEIDDTNALSQMYLDAALAIGFFLENKSNPDAKNELRAKIHPNLTEAVDVMFTQMIFQQLSAANEIE